MRGRSSLAAGAIGLVVTLGGCNRILGPTTPDDAWKIYARGHFTFYVRPDSFAEQSINTLGTVLNDQFAVSVAALKLRYDGTIMMFLHDSGADAGFGDDLGDGNRSGAAYPKTETIRAACVPPLDDGLFSLLSHELNHVITWNGLGRPGTSFVSEGLPSAVISERYHSHGPSYYYHWTKTHRGQLPPLADLVDDEKWTSFDQSAAYSASASFLAYLIEAYGASPMRAIYPASSAAFVERFKAVYGMTLDDAQTAWLAFCEVRG